MMDLELPRYSASVPAPDYSFQPACGERTLQQTPRAARATTESTFIRKSGKTTVVLYNQEDNAKMPRYGRDALVTGSLLFDSSDSICEVVLEIFGKIETMSSESGTETTTLLNNKRVLWSNRYKIGQCPSQIEFSVRIPSSFRDDQEQRPLPPTYTMDFYGTPVLYVRSSYHVQVLITRNITRRVGFLTKMKRILIPFEYQPRTRPHRPIVPSLCFFSGVKYTPEEWHQTIAPIQTSLSVDPGPIFTHLLIPSSRTYGLRDSVPFHVQLSGPEDALGALLKPKPEEHSRRKQSARNNMSTNVPSALPIPCQPSSCFCVRLPLSDSPCLTPRTMNSSSPVSSSPTLRHIPLHRHPTSVELPPSLRLNDSIRPPLRVFLLRQVTLEIRGKKSWRNQILGEAKLLAVPPLLATSCSSQGIGRSQEEDHLDWEGELQISSRYNVGGWQAAGVHVKDFIALSIVPQNEPTSLLSGIQLTVPVKLVTDSYSEGSNGSAVPFETQ